MARPLNTLPKYVASTTLAEPLEWENSSLLQGDVPQAVRGLKEDEGKDLHVIGSPAFVQTLIEHDLVDEYRLMIDPSCWAAASASSAMAVRSCVCAWSRVK